MNVIDGMIKCPVCGSMVNAGRVLGTMDDNNTAISETSESRNRINSYRTPVVNTSAQGSCAKYATVYNYRKHGFVYWCRDKCWSEFSENYVIYRYRWHIQLGLEDI